MSWRRRRREGALLDGFTAQATTAGSYEGDCFRLYQGSRHGTNTDMLAPTPIGFEMTGSAGSEGLRLAFLARRLWWG